MPPATGTRVVEGFKLDKASNTIRFERELNNSPQHVFEAWTDPRQVKLWWDPTGIPLASCDIDLRVGGSFAFVSASHPDRPFTGTYREIDQPRTLVFDAFGAEGRVRLSPTDRGTRMLVEIICTGPEHLEQFVQMGVATGTSQTLDNLVDYLAR